jgi:PII-like signaling protein
MEAQSNIKLLRIFFGESDKADHVPLHEAIIAAARSAKMAGATCWRGAAGFGPTSKIRSDKILDLSTDLPMIVEIVDEEPAVNAFLDQLDELFTKAKCGGMVTIEKVEVKRYRHGEARK